MPKAKRRKNLFGFGRKSSGNYIPASGGIAKHAPKHRAKASSASDSKYDDVAKSLAGKPYKSLSKSQQATVRGIVSKMNPKRKRKRNLEIGLPKNQFVNAKVRMSGGKIQVMADQSVLGKAGFKAGAGLTGVSVSGGAKLNPSYRKTKKAVRKAQKTGALDAGLMFQKWRKATGVSKKGKKRNPPTTQFVVEWGAGTNFFSTLKSAKKFIGGLRSRGLAYGRNIKIVKMEPGKPSKTVFEKSY